MRHTTKEKAPVLLPVRRKLLAVTIAYLCGVFMTHLALPAAWLWAPCALLFVGSVFRLRKRRRALFCIMACALCFGWLRAGGVLRVRDAPSAPGVRIEGTVSAIKRAYRVYLSDVTIEGEPATARDVVVTLMQEEGEKSPPSPQVGQRVQGTGRLFAPEEARNPGDIDGRIQALCDGYELSGYLLPGWSAQGEAAFSIGEAFRRLREHILARVDALFGVQAPLFRGILLGDRTQLDSETVAAMRLTGTVHVLTVSGLHLSAIAQVIGKLLERLPVRRRCRMAILSALLTGFTCLTGAEAGTVRACIMALLREYAVLRGRRYEPLTGLACAALLMTLVRPLWALNASFQFSFFVVLGIQLFAHGFSALARRHVRGRAAHAAMDTVAVSAGAQIASVPMQLLFYGYVPLLSLPMNVACSALMTALLLGGWVATLLGFLWFDAGAACARLLSHAAAAFEAANLWAASLEGAIVRLPAPYGATVLLFAGLMMLCSNRIRYGRWRRQAIAVTACVIALCYVPRLNPQARYVQLDVGQGDAALFRSGRRAVLVDVGPADSYDMLRYLRHEGLLVDAVILSHMDEDHVGALSVLIDSEVEIPAVVAAQDAASDAKLAEPVQAALAQMAEEGVPMHEVSRGDSIDVGFMHVDVLSPWAALHGSNERSLLLFTQMQGVKFLLTGDLPSACEPENVPDCDVLKVAHHGSKSSTSDAFLAQSTPELALISVGANNWYGHPTARVLASLETAGAQVLRTDTHGCTTLWLGDGRWRAQTWL